MTVRFMMAVFWILLCATGAFAQSKIAPPLQKALDQAIEGNGTVRALIMLEDKVDILAFDQQLYAESVSLNERAYRVITTLQAKAEATQGSLLSFLASKSADEVVRYQAFWVANIIAVEAQPSVIMDLSTRLDVGYLQLDGELKYDEPVAREPATEVPNGVEPGLKVINAHLMWQAGITGAGVIVMGMDTGVDVNHPALSYKWKGNSVPASQAWFDPNTGSPTPTDCDNHGTHTMGTMTGLDPATHDTIGVAFGAEWIAAKTICSSPHTSNSISAFQWAMDPDGNPSTHEDMPVGINNSWWDPSITSSTQCNPAQNPYIDVLTAVEASGIGVVFSAGNSGPSSTSITAPKNVNLSEVHFWATGAVDGNNPSLPIASFSSRGPVVSSCLTGNSSLDIKPEASAPGVSVRSSIIGGGYSNFSGTSMAAPHVVGALALLRQAHPNKTGAELKMALYTTATDLGAVGEDNNYGMGVINVWAAHQSLADPDDPNDPENVTAYSDFNTPTSIDLNWTDPTTYVNGDPLTNFTIEIYRDGANVASVASGTETYSDGGLTDGQMYQYTVYAKDSNDSLSSGVDVSAYAGGSPVPAAPENLSGSATTTEA
ncbi:MAG: S8 family serine peptidase, partial [Calditrichaeota bacterium]|nr:S8 family serine peptidase [Calditrichota bacterium]